MPINTVPINATNATASNAMATAATASSIVGVLADAGAAVASIDVSGVDPSELLTVTTELRRLQARCSGLAVAIAQHSKSCGTDPNATLLGTGRTSGRNARNEARRADLADHMPALGVALTDGDITGEHLDAIARARTNLTDQEAELFDSLGDQLAGAAKRLPVDTFDKHVRNIVDGYRADHGLTRLQQQRHRSILKRWIDRDGMGHVHITADPERYAFLTQRIEAEAAAIAAAARGSGETIHKNGQLELDALVELVTNGQAACQPGSRARPSITVVVDQQTVLEGPHPGTICETEAGADLPITVIDRYCCDATIQHVTLDDAGVPINVGRRYRTATSHQWAALRSLDATCAWQGCSRPLNWTQAHHIQYWEEGGRTDLDNLIPLCTQHHHMVHDHGWRLRLHPNRTLEIHHPPNRGRRELGPHTLWTTTTPDRQPRPGRDPNAPPGRRRSHP